jgi:hypothetical protein
MARVFILENAMRLVPAPLWTRCPTLDFPRVADAALRDFRAAGMRVVRTTAPLDV